MRNLKVALMAACAVVVNAAVAEECTYTDGAWSPNAPTSEDSVKMVSGNLEWKSPLPMSVRGWTQPETYAGTVTFNTGLETFTVDGDVDLQGGTWTHTANPTPTTTAEAWTSGRGTKQLIVLCSGSFTLGAAATIDLVGKGFAKAKGPGYSSNCGGAHGGSGCNANGLCYGSPIAPITIGSGGRDSAGGGALRLTVAGALTVEGVIDVDGAKPAFGDDYGAGGSVYLTAGSFAGSGAIHANGGVLNASVGGGGRIAFKRTTAGEIGFGGTVTAYHALSNSRGAPGTIYYERADESAGTGRLVICGGGTATEQRTELADTTETYDFSEIVLTNGATIAVRPGVLVKTAKFVVQSASMSRIAIAGGELRLPSDLVLTNVTIAATSAGGALACGEDGDLRLGKGVTVNANGVLRVAGDLSLADGAKINHTKPSAAVDNGYSAAAVVGGDMTIDASSSVDANALGFAGQGEKGGPGGCSTSGVAASHGGLSKGAPVTKVYGSVRRPATFGSDDNAASGHSGGGRVRLSVGGTLTVDGKICANGGNRDGSGGTSGGSVWIDAGALAGSGVITAVGGQVRSMDTAGGGGGRIAVYLTKSGETFDGFEAAGGRISACGGGAGKAFGATGFVPIGPAGTVYLATVLNGVTNGTLVIDNENASNPYGETAIGPNVTDADVDNVVFRKGGILRVTQDGALTVRGYWTRDLTGRDGFSADGGDADHAAGTVVFADASRTSTVVGANDFANLVCETPGKLIKFGLPADTVTRIVANGKLSVLGDDTDRVTLRSVQDGTRWLLDVSGDAAATVQYADVRDSDAKSLGGLSVSAKDSTDSGNNDGWIFSSVVIGETNEWQGGIDGNWGNPANWSRNRNVEPTDVVLIPAGTDHAPALTAATVLNSLVIELDATLSLAGFDLTVTNSLTVSGHLVASAGETITLSGPSALLTGGSFAAAQSTVVLTGDGEQTFDPAEQTFYGLVVSKSGGLVSFMDGLAATRIDIAASAPLACLFTAGKTVRATDCYVSGGAQSPNLTFSSRTSGETWNLAVTRQGRIQGVILSGCKASELPLNDDLPGYDGGRNQNWRFGCTYCQWIGGASGLFSDENCWSGGRVPDETSLVYFDSNAKVTLSGSVTVREFQAAAGTVSIAKGTNVLTVAESLAVENGATLELTTPCVVSNSVIVRTGGALTHEAITAAPGANTNRLFLTVLGDMLIESNARVHADEKGFTCSCRGGFGTCSSNAGVSHGGNGGDALAYDSVFAPQHPGSTPGSGDWDNNAGGVIRLIVGGTLTVNGSVSASPTPSRWWMGSPGAIWITAGRLEGSGRISADAAEYTSNGSRYVSGGRVAVILTKGDFSDWTGQMTAYPVPAEGKLPAPGTVYCESAEDGPKGGTIYIANRSGDTARTMDAGRTPLPVPGWSVAEDFRNVRLVLENRLAFAVTENVKVADALVLGKSNDRAKFYLNDKLLSVGSMEHRTGRGWLGDPKKKDVDAFCDKGPSGCGEIVWHVPGLMLFVR